MLIARCLWLEPEARKGSLSGALTSPACGFVDGQDKAEWIGRHDEMESGDAAICSHEERLDRLRGWSRCSSEVTIRGGKIWGSWKMFEDSGQMFVGLKSEGCQLRR